jgi:hypothetical protein
VRRREYRRRAGLVLTSALTVPVVPYPVVYEFIRIENGLFPVALCVAARVVSSRERLVPDSGAAFTLKSTLHRPFVSPFPHCFFFDRLTSKLL